MTDKFVVPEPSREAVDDLRDTKLRGHSFDEVRAMVALVYRRDLPALVRSEVERALMAMYQIVDADGDACYRGAVHADAKKYLAARFSAPEDVADDGRVYRDVEHLSPQPSAGEREMRVRWHFGKYALYGVVVGGDGSITYTITQHPKMTNTPHWWLRVGRDQPTCFDSPSLAAALDWAEQHAQPLVPTPTEGERKNPSCAYCDGTGWSEGGNGHENVCLPCRGTGEHIRPSVPTPSAGETKCKCLEQSGYLCKDCMVGARPEGKETGGFRPEKHIGHTEHGDRVYAMNSVCTACACPQCKAERAFLKLFVRDYLAQVDLPAELVRGADTVAAARVVAGE